MCGIAGIILKKPGAVNISELLVGMSSALSHRGPDGEGFMLATQDQTLPYFGRVNAVQKKQDLPYLPSKQLPNGNEKTFLAFAHRRLAIIDLTETGHQPMCDEGGKLWITFNGEVYNYKELREELKVLGHTFVSQSDTEVVIHAYREWGTACVERFNGMWAFCLYDKEKNICFASRDRLGVKPFYYFESNELFAFGSEQKAFVKSGILVASVTDTALSNYLVNGMMEYASANFFEGLSELFPGHNLLYDLNSHTCKVERYFNIEDIFSLENDHLDESVLVEKIKSTLERSVQLRLRSDVEVGTCLSGGIDSSALAVMMAAHNKSPVNCFTSVFRGSTFNEEPFADEVVHKIHGKHFKVEPTLKGFLEEADELIYSQDVPIWSTSTYAQHKVMALAKEQHIKVVLDGQGADELFGGYHHHFLAQWNSLLAQGKYAQAISNMKVSKKTIKNPFLFFLKEKTKEKVQLNRKRHGQFFSEDFLKTGDPKNPLIYFDDVNLQLADDITRSRLKAFLKCEDRCGMWHGVESRTPFSDDSDLIKLMFSFNGNKKIKYGVSKYLLREATKEILPQNIYTRYDKVGFETPMKQWMLEMRPILLDEIKTSQLPFIKRGVLEKLDLERNFDRQLVFKLFVFGRWQKIFKS